MTKIVGVKNEQEIRVSQGDLIRNVEYIEYVLEENGEIEISKIKFPLVLILTQDCDLTQDFKLRNTGDQNQDKQLISVLVAPVYNFEQFKEGKHLEKLNLNMRQFGNSERTETNMLKNNKISRYHFLAFPNNIQIVDSIIDFKHYFSVNTAYLEKLKKENFVCQVSELFREDISQRFSSFLSRIGLPNMGVEPI